MQHIVKCVGKTLQVSDQTWDLVPELLDHLGTAFRPRSEDMMPMPNFDHGTVVVKTFSMTSP